MTRPMEPTAHDTGGFAGVDASPAWRQEIPGSDRNRITAEGGDPPDSRRRPRPRSKLHALNRTHSIMFAHISRNSSQPLGGVARADRALPAMEMIGGAPYPPGHPGGGRCRE